MNLPGFIGTMHHTSCGWGLLTELPGLLGCGFYKYGAPDGARNFHSELGYKATPGLQRFLSFALRTGTKGAFH